MESKPAETCACAECGGTLEITVRACPDCGMAYHAPLPFPRLARLARAERELVEDFLRTGGNLSELARQYGISRPTIRQRIDALLAVLEALRQADEARCQVVLEQVESGAITAEAAARTLRELHA